MACHYLSYAVQLPNDTWHSVKFPIYHSEIWHTELYMFNNTWHSIYYSETWRDEISSVNDKWHALYYNIYKILSQRCMACHYNNYEWMLLLLHNTLRVLLHDALSKAAHCHCSINLTKHVISMNLNTVYILWVR